MTITTIATRRIPGVELELTITGAPREDESTVTGARLAYSGQELTEVSVITEDDELPYRTDLLLHWPGWLHVAVEEHRPLTPEQERRRIADLLARAYNGRPLDELQDEDAAHHLKTADAVLAPSQGTATVPA